MYGCAQNKNRKTLAEQGIEMQPQEARTVKTTLDSARPVTAMRPPKLKDMTYASRI